MCDMLLSSLVVVLVVAAVVACIAGMRSLRAFVRALWPH
jgi:hypothetical protein